MNLDSARFLSDFPKLFGPVPEEVLTGLGKYLECVVADPVWSADPGLVEREQLAYITATAYHECKFQPQEEIGRGRGRGYGRPVEIRPGVERIFYGRGLVQLTWLENYRKMSEVCQVDLVESPDLALEYPHCYTILVIGSLKGMFTGRALHEYVRAERTDFFNARRVINGLDRAGLIQIYAQRFSRLIFVSLLSASALSSQGQPAAPDSAPEARPQN